MSFKEYLLSKGFSKKTMITHQKQVLAYLAWADSQAVEPEFAQYLDVLGYVGYLKQRGITQISIHNYINSIRHYYNWLIVCKIRKDNPTENLKVKGIKRRVLHHILDRQELEKIYFDYRNIKGERLSKKRNEIIVGLLVYQGLTTSEIQRLSIQDISLREGKLLVSASRKTSGRTLKLEAYQILDLMEYVSRIRPRIVKLKKKHNHSNSLFMSQGSGINLGNVFQRLIKQLRYQSPKVKSAKQIRASVITHWLKNYNLREVQHMAGHRYVSSTENYMINDLEDLTRHIEKYHPMG